jgi:Carboxymuconolactone decarboxylase family
MAAMSAKIERLEMGALAPALQQALAVRVKRLGYLGEFFKCSGHQPDALLPFMAMTDALKEALPDRLTEVGALTVSVLMGNAYERNQHERLSEKLEFGRDWIAAVIAVAPDRDGPLSAEERAVQRLVIAVVERRGHGVEAELDAVVDAIGAAPAMAMLFLIGRYVTQAFVVNALALAPPVPSIFGEAS